MNTRERVLQYIETWKERGYSQDIPDEVPDELMNEGLAPSYKAICFALLKNDMQLTSLGYSATNSKWYGVLKRIEIEGRTSQKNKKQLMKKQQNTEKIKEYSVHLKSLWKEQLIGTHKLGELTRTCTHNHWSIFDPTGLLIKSGRAMNGQSMRNHITKAVEQWVKKNP